MCKFVNIFRGGKSNTRTCKGLLSLMLITTAFASCTHESEDLNNFSGKPLDIQVGIQETTTSRAVITGQNLIDGSLVGVTVVDATGTAYQGQDYNNVCYTAATVDGKQQWTPDKDVTLSGEPATLYAYYPWTDGVDVSAIPVDMTEANQTDWMYATPVEGLNDANATAQVKLHHALVNVKLTLYKESYSGAGEVTAFSVQSDGAATGGTLNAKTGAFTATVNDGQTITRTVTYTLTDKASATPFDCMVVPTGEEAEMTVTVTVDGHTYSSTTDAFSLAKATAYNLALKLTSTGLSVTSVSLTDWCEEPLPDADFEPVISDPWANISNGVYAVAADGSPVEVANATAECIAVVLVQGPHKFMIEKTQSYDATNTSFYWERSCTDLSLENYTKADGKNSYGYLPKADGSYQATPYLSGDYITWTSGALSDFNGKANTEVIVAASTNGRDMGIVLKSFNAAADQNQGYSDWYIPACGQLALMYINITAINEALTKIGGTRISDDYYFSSSEYNRTYGCSVNFNGGRVGNLSKSSNYRVRFVRDI